MNTWNAIGMGCVMCMVLAMSSCKDEQAQRVVGSTSVDPAATAEGSVPAPKTGQKPPVEPTSDVSTAAAGSGPVIEGFFRVEAFKDPEGKVVSVDDIFRASWKADADTKLELAWSRSVLGFRGPEITFGVDVLFKDPDGSAKWCTARGNIDVLWEGSFVTVPATVKVTAKTGFKSGEETNQVSCNFSIQKSRLQMRSTNDGAEVFDPETQATLFLIRDTDKPNFGTHLE